MPEGTKIPEEIACCVTCFLKLVPLNNSCPQCGGTRYPVKINQPNCPGCRHWKVSFISVIAYGEYISEFRQDIRSLKYDQSGDMARFWTKILLFYRRDRLEKINADLIMPIPMHRFRHWRRGINAPEIIAAELGKALKIPFYNNVLVKEKWTRRQAVLSPRERQANVKGSFAMRKRIRSIFFKDDQFIQGKTVLLVDDILTTGSTCNEATKVLLEAGATKVYVAVIARGQGEQTTAVGRNSMPKIARDLFHERNNQIH